MLKSGRVLHLSARLEATRLGRLVLAQIACDEADGKNKEDYCMRRFAVYSSLIFLHACLYGSIIHAPFVAFLFCLGVRQLDSLASKLGVYDFVLAGLLMVIKDGVDVEPVFKRVVQEKGPPIYMGMLLLY